MKEKIDLLGAIVAHVIFVSSIITFSSRMIFKLQPGHWIGIPILLMAFPLGYLLIAAPERSVTQEVSPVLRKPFQAPPTCKPGIGRHRVRVRR